jgi:hypothetical protein
LLLLPARPLELPRRSLPRSAARPPSLRGQPASCAPLLGLPTVRHMLLLLLLLLEN